MNAGWGSLRVESLRRRLRDQRGGRVVFAAHCLLNENVRYLGGATRSGGVNEVVDGLQRQGVGICQMPCPEQQVWGGVLKRHLLLAYGADRTSLRHVRPLLARLFLGYTRWRYARLAHHVAGEMADYRRSGFEVVGLLGIDGSPSCGVTWTLDLDGALAEVVACDPRSVDRAAFNRRAILDNLVPGEGLFTTALRRDLGRRRLDVAIHAHDLAAELEGRPIPPIEFAS